MIGLTACNAPKPYQVMNQAETLLDSRPDSALLLLNNLSDSDIIFWHHKARYALLKSAALDKNSIDTTTFEILLPALEYYHYLGGANDKLRAHYYAARIFQNKSRADRALIPLKKGIKAVDNTADVDSIYLALSYREQARAYYALCDTVEYVNFCLKAASLYQQLGQKNDEAEMLLNGLSGAAMLNNKPLADSILTQCLHVNPTQVENSTLLVRYKMVYALQFGSQDDIRSLLYLYKNKHNSNSDTNLDLALAYSRLEENDSALKLLDSVKDSKCEYDTLKYLTLAIELTEKSGNLTALPPLYKQYTQEINHRNQLHRIREKQAIEEYLQAELDFQDYKYTESRVLGLSVCGALFLIAIITGLIVCNRNNTIQKELNRERAKNYELANKQLLSNSEFLRQEIARMEQELEHTKLSSEAEQALKERIEMFNSLLATHISKNDLFYEVYSRWIESLMTDSNNLMNSTRLTLQASHPKFIKHFQDHGLTTDELNYICLYALGLKGKEVGAYLKKRSHVNMSSAIRKKLGIDQHETNLGIYVRKLLKNS